MDKNELLKEYKKIVVIGYPHSGKTTLVNSWNVTDRIVVHTDDYIKEGFEAGLYSIMDTIKEAESYIVEGVQGYRLLRKLVQYNLPQPDIIIICISSAECLPKHKSMRKALNTVWNDYLTYGRLPRICSKFTY